MKKFTKLLAIPLCFLITSTATSCSAATREIALITDFGDIDDGSFNQESWDAVTQYAREHHKSYDYYRPFNDSDFARECAIKQAVVKGAKVVILSGFKFATSAAYVQNKFPNVHFLLIDSDVKEGDNIVKPNSNTCCVNFSCETTGFLAGYTVATDYLNYDIAHGEAKSSYNFGYCGGMQTDGCYQYGYGFIQGIANAVADKFPNINDRPNVHILYMYANVFAQSDAAAVALKSWFSSEGTKAVFACGGKLYQSVTEAVSDYNKKHKYDKYVDWDKGQAPREAARWIGVDSDQYLTLKYPNEKQSIITSALKGIKQSIFDALNFHFANKWEDEIGGPFSEIDPANYKWKLGLDTKFGRSESVNKHDYIGIAYDENSKESDTIRGFYNFTLGDFKTIRRHIIEDGMNIYGDEKISKTDSKYYEYHVPGEKRLVDFNNQGVPKKMVSWVDSENNKFKEEYLRNFTEDKLDIHIWEC